MVKMEGSFIIQSHTKYHEELYRQASEETRVQVITLNLRKENFTGRNLEGGGLESLE